MADVATGTGSTSRRRLRRVAWGLVLVSAATAALLLVRSGRAVEDLRREQAAAAYAYAPVDARQALHSGHYGIYQWTGTRSTAGGSIGVSTYFEPAIRAADVSVSQPGGTALVLEEPHPDGWLRQGREVYEAVAYFDAPVTGEYQIQVVPQERLRGKAGRVVVAPSVGASGRTAAWLTLGAGCAVALLVGLVLPRSLRGLPLDPLVDLPLLVERG